MALTDGVQLCVRLVDYIDEDDYFTHYELGVITYDSNKEAKISRVHPGGIPAFIGDGVLCGNITEPGIYVGIKVVLDADDTYKSLLGQGIAGSVIYWILLGCVPFFFQSS